MKHLLHLSRNLLLLIIFHSCSTNDDTILTKSADENNIPISFLNVSYGSDEAQVYDLYLPANRSADFTKVLVFIHGGGWIQGDKTDMQAYIPLLQENHPQHAIVNINYRLAQPTKLLPAFPNQFLDLKQALEQLYKDADDLGIKPEFGLIGVSAGAHLALQYDNVYDNLDLVKLVCSIVGPTNLTDPFYSENPSFVLAMEFLIDKSAYPESSDYALAVSPAYLVGQHSSATILFYGEDDDLVPISNGTFLQEQLDNAGVINSFTTYEGGHGNWEDRVHTNLQLQLKDFIDIHLAIEN